MYTNKMRTAGHLKQGQVKQLNNVKITIGRIIYKKLKNKLLILTIKIY
jgi:hypothetical protein